MLGPSFSYLSYCIHQMMLSSSTRIVLVVLWSCSMTFGLASRHMFPDSRLPKSSHAGNHRWNYCESSCALSTLDLILIVAVYGTNRSKPDSDFEEGDMTFLEKSYFRFWRRLNDKLSKKDIEPVLAFHSEDALGFINHLCTQNTLGIRIDGASRWDCNVHIYNRDSDLNIEHDIYRVINSRVDLW